MLCFHDEIALKWLTLSGSKHLYLFEDLQPYERNIVSNDYCQSLQVVVKNKPTGPSLVFYGTFDIGNTLSSTQAGSRVYMWGVYGD